MNQNKLRLILTIACICFAVLAVAFLIFGIVYSGDHIFTKILLFVIAVVSLAAAGELAFILWFSDGGEEPNFFLFDRARKRNISAEELTDKLINDRMMEFFAGYASSEGKLWTSGALERAQMEAQYKPAVAYKLFYDLAVIDKEAGWKCFDTASVATIEFICQGLEANGDVDMAGYIRQFKNTQPINMAQFRQFIVSNKDYFGAKLCMYVRENVSKFE